MKKIFSIFLALALSCKSEPRPEASSPRIVSLLPNVTEIIFEMGMGDHIVGATRYCTRPKEALSIPRVGGILDVSSEAVLRLKPDIVIGSPSVLSGKTRAVLEEAKIKVLPLAVETLDDMFKAIETIGEVLKKGQEAMALAQKMRERMNALRGCVKPLGTIFVVGRNPLVVAGPRSSQGAIIEVMGLKNLVEDGSVTYPTWSFEQVIKSRPELVIDGSIEGGSLSDLLESAGLNGALLIKLNDDALLRPAPSMLEGAKLLCDKINLMASK